MCAACCSVACLVMLLDRDGHHQPVGIIGGPLTPPTSTQRRSQPRHRLRVRVQTHTHTRARTQTRAESELSHGSLVDAQSGCCQSELNPASLAAFPLTLPASGRVFNILFRIPALSAHGCIGWTRRLSATRQISK